jgi:hypothetical protein
VCLAAALEALPRDEQARLERNYVAVSASRCPPHTWAVVSAGRVCGGGGGGGWLPACLRALLMAAVPGDSGTARVTAASAHRLLSAGWL